MAKTKDDFSEGNEVKSNWIQWGKPGVDGDKFFGTLIGRREVASTLPGKEGEKQQVYDFKVDYGAFHPLDEDGKPTGEVVTLNEGEFWSVGGRLSLDGQMRNIRIGQKVGLKYIEDKPSKKGKKFHPAKIIKVYAPRNDDNTPKMDTAFLESQNDGFGSLPTKEE